MTDALTNFQDHLLAQRVARRVMGATWVGPR